MTSSTIKRLPKIGIIGGGLSGLSTAYHLLKHLPCSVTIYEKLDRLGGRMVRHNNTYDAGAQYFTMRSTEMQDFLKKYKPYVHEWSPNHLLTFDSDGKWESIDMSKQPQRYTFKHGGIAGFPTLLHRLCQKKANPALCSSSSASTGSREFTVEFNTSIASFDECPKHVDTIVLATDLADQQAFYKQSNIPFPSGDHSLDPVAGHSYFVSLPQHVLSEVTIPLSSSTLPLHQIDGIFINDASLSIRWICLENSKYANLTQRESRHYYTVQSSKELSSESLLDILNEVMNTSIFTTHAKVEGHHHFPSAASSSSLSNGFLKVDNVSPLLVSVGDWTHPYRGGVESAFLAGHDAADFLSSHYLKDHFAKYT